MRMMTWQGLACFIVIALNQHLCQGRRRVYKVEDTFTCHKEDIVQRRYDRCWIHNPEHYDRFPDTILCCPKDTYCCEVLSNSNSSKPLCCPSGNSCKTDGTCDAKEQAYCHISNNYTTFDGQKMDEVGSCRMSIVKSHIRSINTENFEIFAKNFYYKAATFPEYVELYILNDIYRIQYNREKAPLYGEVYIAEGPPPVDMKAKGKLIDLSKPYFGKNVSITIVTENVNQIYLSTDFGLQIRFRGFRFNSDYIIYLEERYKNHVTGFCGDYDGRERSDLVVASDRHKGLKTKYTHGHYTEVSQFLIAPSYVVHDDEPLNDRCNKNPPKVNYAPVTTSAPNGMNPGSTPSNPVHDMIIKGACHVIYDQEGPFAECVAKLGEDRTKTVFDKCVHDGTQTGYPTVCKNLKALIEECRKHQITIKREYEPNCDEDISKCF